MPYTLTQLATDLRTALEAEPGHGGREKARAIVTRALKDEAFVAEHLKDRPAGGNPREVLYQDPKLGFCICGHVYEPNAVGNPHDHGTSWAIYGQATGITEMTDWKIVKPGDAAGPSLVEPVRTYEMKAGDVKLYDVNVVHSPNRQQPTKLIRIEGELGDVARFAGRSVVRGAKVA